VTLVNDAGFEDLVSEVATMGKLEREAVLKLIAEKKSKVGGGYLTDQGALFLVASDLGVTVEYDQNRPVSLSQLATDSKSLSVQGRLLAVGVPKVFSRKADSSRGLLAKLVLYDASGPAVASLWDSAVARALDASLKPGVLICISDAYTRQGLDGRAELNVGEKGQFEKLSDEDSQVRKIDPLEKLVIAPSAVSDTGRFLVVRGKVTGEVRRSNFNRSDGTASSLSSFSITDELASSTPVRVVIWNNSSPAFEKLQDGQVVTLLNVRTKISTFQNTAGLEIHGDETTNILELFDETRTWLLEKTKEFSHATKNLPEQQKTTRALPFVGRVVSKRFSSTDKKYHLLIVDSQKHKFSVTASEEATKIIGEEIHLDGVVICRPDSLEGIRATCTSVNSISKVSAKRSDIPESSSLMVRVEEIPAKDGAVVSLEAICLSGQPSREIQTKDGLVKRSELTVADHTGEIKVFAWRNLSKLLEEFSAGDRIALNAVETQVFEGRKFLLLKNYSTVEKKPISS
jgi:hypothetical protein